MAALSGAQIEREVTAMDAAIERTPMTDEEDQVWRIVQRHKGQPNAITSRAIEDRTQINRHRVRGIVRTLRVVHRLPVFSCGDGYFMARNDEERDACLERLWNHAMETLVAYARLKNASLESVFSALREQMKLFPDADLARKAKSAGGLFGSKGGE